MLAVGNTSPISNLALIGRLDLLREQLGSVIIPPGVWTELSRHPNSAAKHTLEKALADRWLSVVPLAAAVPAELASTLDLGEAEALALALEVKADLVLLDESAARLKARELGLAHAGVLGVLRQARQTNRIASLKAEIVRLRLEARFFISPALEKRSLLSVGE
jgi:predicted nucleic acid-binding protein